MNTKNNKRRRESIAKIEHVFVELLQTKQLNQITVSDICKKAGL
ncbi:MAG: TetR/AcrR family transcriptional regulator, partial [Clostridia bacterium]|nr:TetR/AcrR family transcriptional regulator [Clostridia bacterium]